MAGVYLLSSQILLRKYEDLERKEATRNIQRVSDELAYQLQEMHSNSTDWSNWDDTYRFMGDGNQAFVQSNLTGVLLNLDVMAFLDSNGKVLQSYRIPRKGHQAPPYAEELRKALRFDRGVSGSAAGNREYCGLANLANGDAVLVSVRPIVRTSGLGPSRGWIVFGLRLDDRELKRLAERSHLDIEIFRLDPSAMPSDCREAYKRLTNDVAIETQPLSKQTVASYTLLRDVFGHPTVLLRGVESRAIYAEGVSSQRYLLQFLTIAGVIFSLVILLVFEVTALSRVSKLSAQVERVGANHDDEGRVSLAGKDELSWLALKIDGMVQSLKEGKLALRTKNDNLERTVQRLAASNYVLANAVEGIAEFDAKSRIVNLNSAFAEMHGYDGGSLEGFHWQTLIAPEDHERIFEAIADTAEHRRVQCEVRGRRRDGSYFEEEIVMVAAMDETDLVACHWFTKDISERKKLESQIQYQAFHDLLTGLPNRALFVDRLQTACLRAQRRAESIAVLFLDLDDFKAINDSMGHDAGDHVLAGVANRIQRCIRQQDTVARLGGDEFTVLLDGISNIEEAIEIAERIIDAMEAPIPLAEGRACASTSIGIVFSKNGDRDADALLNDADTAMYHAKGTAKSSYSIFNPAMNRPALERKQLSDALAEALENDRLLLNYQPVIDLKTGKASGIEALLRWNDPDRGEVAPNVFIHVAEEAGMMDALGTWSLRHACAQMKQWLEVLPKPNRMTVNVNLSGKQLQRPDLLATINAALIDSKLPPGRLCLEVAAKLVSIDPKKTLDTLHALKELGVKLAIDDFGTGSLISKLSDYPFDIVKIDGSVTWLLESSEEARALAQAMMLIAKSAKIQVAAEGVETLAQIQILRQLGCAYGQGFFFGKPLPGDQVLEMLSRGTPLTDDDISSDFAA